MKKLREYLNEGLIGKQSGLDVRSKIEAWMEKQYVYGSYKINDDMTIDVKGQFNLEDKEIEELPDYIQFGEVFGRFDISHKNLKNLKGCPKKCTRFHCNYCKNLESLEGCPIVSDGFDCSYCTKLESLKGQNCVDSDNLQFYCNGCTGLKTLEGELIGPMEPGSLCTGPVPCVIFKRC